MWARRLREALSRAAGVLPEPRGSVVWTRATRFSEVARGTRVHIAGIARELDRPLTSPVTQRPCLAYRLVVEKPGSRPALDVVGCGPFFLQDGDVMVRVDGPFRVLLHAAFEWDFGDDIQRRIASAIEADRAARARFPSRLETEFAEFVRRNFEPDPELAPPDPLVENYRYFEALVRPGDRITVEGFASVTVEPSGERAGLREPPLLYAVSGTEDSPVLLAFPEPGSLDR